MVKILPTKSTTPRKTVFAINYSAMLTYLTTNQDSHEFMKSESTKLMNDGTKMQSLWWMHFGKMHIITDGNLKVLNKNRVDAIKILKILFLNLAPNYISFYYSCCSKVTNNAFKWVKMRLRQEYFFVSDICTKFTLV